MVAVAARTVLQQSSEPFAMEELEVTVLMPCLNEAETVATSACTRRAVSCNGRALRGRCWSLTTGSSDGSPELAL